MERVQVNFKLPKAISLIAKLRAEEEHVSLQGYLESLVLEDLGQHSDTIRKTMAVVGAALDSYQQNINYKMTTEHR